MRIPQRSDKGFTLIEILIALALLAIIGAVVIPNITGYIGRGEQAAYNSDLKAIQGAVNGYYADPANRVSSGAKKGQKQYPILGVSGDKTAGGVPTPNGGGTAYTAGTGYLIDFAALVSGNYLNAVPASASLDNNAAYTGDYSWYVDASGTVQSGWIGNRNNTGFQTGVYP